MKMKWKWAFVTILFANVSCLQAGNLDPTNAPAPTMHTLEEIYQKLLSVEEKILKNQELLVSLGARHLPEPNVIPEMVTVRNPGNANDSGGTGHGAVSYDYEIGKYEVSNAEYAQFLNAVDPTGANELSLYNTQMNTDSRGGISNNTDAVSGAKYVAKPGRENKPVVFVNFYDAVRFCNWLHNGAVPGGDTESGAYTLLGGTVEPSNGLTVQRNLGAEYAVPTEDEWYKAAYYDPINAGADAGGNQDYWLYPTMSDTAPTAGAPSGVPNTANYDGSVGNLTDVGAYTNTPSHYGTFDQGGNAFEWTETVNGPLRVLRGGAWGNAEVMLRSETQTDEPPIGSSLFIGFRIVRP